MKFCITIIAAALLSAGCSSSKNYARDSSNPYTIDKYDACVHPAEEHFIKQYGVKVYRHKDCMGVDDLLAVVWAGERDDQSITGASLIALGYVTRLARNAPTEQKYSASYLDVGSFPYRGEVAHVAFFEIKEGQ